VFIQFLIVSAVWAEIIKSLWLLLLPDDVPALAFFISGIEVIF
jgi:hypothetical protein